jgi:hypothetical protein
MGIKSKQQRRRTAIPPITALGGTQFWYQQYFSQCWYRNTFLVNSPEEIGHTISKDKEWNSIIDSGCNFTCLAMMIGIDPAHLATRLGEIKFFKEDPRSPATCFNGKRSGLVWDRNRPDKKKERIIESLWNPTHGHFSVDLSLSEVKQTSSYKNGAKYVADFRDRNLHVVCGPTDHSHLVAGYTGVDFFVWDPDLDWAERVGLEPHQLLDKNLSGALTLKWLFHYYEGRRIEFWAYRLLTKLHGFRVTT